MSRISRSCPGTFHSVITLRASARLGASHFCPSQVVIYVTHFVVLTPPSDSKDSIKFLGYCSAESRPSMMSVNSS